MVDCLNPQFCQNLHSCQEDLSSLHACICFDANGTENHYNTSILFRFFNDFRILDKIKGKLNLFLRLKLWFKFSGNNENLDNSVNATRFYFLKKKLNNLTYGKILSITCRSC